jgi:cell division septum initiation protein DivIVA
MKSSITTALAIILSCVGTDILAQGTQTHTMPLSTLQPIRPMTDMQTPTERIAALETQVAQLTSQVKSLNTQLAQTSKNAFNANFNAGLATVWINTYGDAASEAGQWVKGGAPGQLNQILNIVTQNAQGISANAQGIKDVDARLNFVCKSLMDMEKGQMVYDSLAQCRASTKNADYLSKLALTFY